jgi:signal transduction histidine kinase
MLEGILDSLDVIAYTFDRDRHIIYANRAARKALHLDEGREAVIGRAQPGHFEENKYFDEDGNELSFDQASMLTDAFNGKATRHRILEHRNLRTRQHEWLEIDCIPAMDEDGLFDYGILIYRDISGRKRREHKLEFLLKTLRILSSPASYKERMEEQAKLLVPSLADWCALDIVQPEGTIERVAFVHRDPSKVAALQARYRALHLSQREMPSASVIAMGKPIFAPNVGTKWEEAAEFLRPEIIESLKAMNIGSAMVLPIGLPGGVLGALSIAYAESGREYTEEDLAFFTEYCLHLGVILENARLYNEIKRRDLAKDAFLAALSHELRNPLAPIKSSLEIMRLENQDENLTHDIDIVEHQFDHIARLLNDLLDSTRFTRGMVHLERKSIDVKEIVEHVVRAREPIARKAGVRLRANYEGNSYMAFADKTRTEQALSNLVSNAIKFTPEGGDVTVSLSNDEHSVSVSVKDTGFGMTREEMSRVFELYYRGDRLRRHSSGLGVGLGLVHQIALLQGGSVEAKSEGENKGSEFIFTLPRRG